MRAYWVNLVKIGNSNTGKHARDTKYFIRNEATTFYVSDGWGDVPITKLTNSINWRFFPQHKSLSNYSADWCDFSFSAIVQHYGVKGAYEWPIYQL
jgi:hypothetical protein